MKQSIIVVNKSGGVGAGGFLDVKGDKGNANSPCRTAKEYLDAVKGAPPNTMKMGGAGSE